MNFSVKFLDSVAEVELPDDFDIIATFESGQAFRWKSVVPGVFQGVAGDHRARVSRTAAGISIDPCAEADFAFWRHYLDLDRDYAACEAQLKRDPALADAVAAYAGLRVLNQPPWECLASFLLSSNNNVRRISQIVERLCSCYGEDRGGCSAFPKAERLREAGEKGVFGCGAGYRAEFLFLAAQAIAEGFDPDALHAASYEQAKAELMRLKGVGEKVADCVLLYSCGFGEAFPVDVWVARAMLRRFPGCGKTREEIGRFARARWGKLAGLAQQYLFHFERMNG